MILTKQAIVLVKVGFGEYNGADLVYCHPQSSRGIYDRVSIFGGFLEDHKPHLTRQSAPVSEEEWTYLLKSSENARVRSFSTPGLVNAVTWSLAVSWTSTNYSFYHRKLETLS